MLNHKKRLFAFLSLVILMLVLTVNNRTLAISPDGFVKLSGHIPSQAISQSVLIGQADPNEKISLAIALPLRNQIQLDDFLHRLYDPADPQYGHYLTSAQFADNFGPSQATYASVMAFVKSAGLTVTQTYNSRSLLDVSGSESIVEQAFAVHLNQYKSADGHVFHAPSENPSVPTSISQAISGIVGLDNASNWHPNNVRLSSVEGMQFGTNQIGAGPGGGLTPLDIHRIYDFDPNLAFGGVGETLGLFELDGYRISDINAYNQFYFTQAGGGVTSLPIIQNVLIDGFSGTPGSSADEVTLDIELQLATARFVKKIIVYEAPNSTSGVVDTYHRIANDNQAIEISSSWGSTEQSTTASTRNSENSAFQQMAAQGQTIFVASGDTGAYADGSSLSVQDPASQPYVTAVGGTTLSTNSSGNYLSEAPWANPNQHYQYSGGPYLPHGLGGGGGISSFWPLPSYQSGFISIASFGSPTMRNIPDVSLNADPNTGYSIYYNGAWTIYGGTSCAAPIWAGYVAQVNSNRDSGSRKSGLGFLNPTLYAIARGARYSNDFHDINNYGTNLYYPAVGGYDDATGLGSLDGYNLYTDLLQAP